MAEKEHVLTEKEKIRAEKLKVITKDLEAQGYTRKDQTISINYANIMAFVLSIPFILLFGALFISRYGFSFDVSFLDYLLFVLIIIVLIVVHELIHGLTWGILAPHHFKTIDFGFIKEKLTPYCTCGEPLSKAAYIAGSFMPCLILGIIPSIISLFNGQTLWLYTGIFMIMGAGGDLTVILKMLFYRTNASKLIIMDHPTEVGFIIFEK